MHPYTFAKLVYLTADIVGGNIIQEGVATGGSATTIVDTVMRTEADDYWNEGALIVLETTDDLAPAWEMRTISDFVNTTSTVTVGTAFSAAVGAGDSYAILKKRYPLNIIKQQVNLALTRLGAVPREDTSLTAVADQTEYTLPLVANPLLRQVWYNTNDDDSNDNQWSEIVNWSVRHGAPGTGDTLIIPQLTAGKTIRLIYMGRHARLEADDDYLQEDIPVERVVYPAALGCLQWYRDKTRTDDFRDMILYLQDLTTEFESLYPIIQPRRPNKLFEVGRI
jgi:hypothetical protein